MATPRTLFAKIWDRHVVASPPDAPDILAIDLHLLHEVTSPQAFAGLAARGLGVRRPDKTVATMDHSTPTRRGGLALADAGARGQLVALEANCAAHGIALYPLGAPDNGIVHVIGGELGLTQPGKTIVCGDSHTSTHGAFGALAFGIGTSEVEHVLATQCLLQRRPKTLRVTFDGAPPAGVTAKDLILAMIAQIGIGGATGHVIEYAGAAIRALDMEGRMTVCNMSIEAGARAGMIAPDDTTFAYLRGRPFAPRGEAFDRAVATWRGLASDDGAVFDRELHIDASAVEPMITWGTNPGQGIGITQRVPDPARVSDAGARAAIESALRYTRVEPGQPLLGVPIDVVFLGSCTNSRLGDLRAAAEILRDRKVAARVRMLVVPGSARVKAAAEAEGLDRVFLAAGAEWREPGCSMCIAMNGDELAAGQIAVSTSNRNFEGRQGKGSRTLLASPATAAAAAVMGHIADPRTLRAPATTAATRSR
ncbi:MAG TPA: 3-isopropylmalate dehydratase large subunit [Kofleriaceae bacterium]|nr:3-isopropylmalate dehydratase large subunit [Kofleriaceae bacterium]